MTDSKLVTTETDKVPCAPGGPMNDDEKANVKADLKVDVDVKTVGEYFVNAAPLAAAENDNENDNEVQKEKEKEKEKEQTFDFILLVKRPWDKNRYSKKNMDVVRKHCTQEEIDMFIDETDKEWGKRVLLCARLSSEKEDEDLGTIQVHIPDNCTSECCE